MPEYFRLKFTIEGVPELSRILLMAHKKVGNLKEPLWRAARLVLADVERQFVTEGALSGGWAPLAESTVAGRMRGGYGAGPILQNTGSLRGSFGAAVTQKKAVITSKGVPYFKYHQSRGRRAAVETGYSLEMVGKKKTVSGLARVQKKVFVKAKLPRRPMLVMPDRTRQNIVEVFHKFVRFR